jgi:hypothetical protein
VADSISAAADAGEQDSVIHNFFQAAVSVSYCHFLIIDCKGVSKAVTKKWQ